MPTAYHMVHYRKYVSSDPKVSLEALCRSALATADTAGSSLWQRVGDRFFDIPDGGKVSDDDAILRTKMPFDLPHEGSNFLDFENVADQLQEV